MTDCPLDYFTPEILLALLHLHNWAMLLLSTLRIVEKLHNLAISVLTTHFLVKSDIAHHNTQKKRFKKNCHKSPKKFLEYEKVLNVFYSHILNIAKFQIPHPLRIRPHRHTEPNIEPATAVQDLSRGRKEYNGKSRVWSLASFALSFGLRRLRLFTSFARQLSCKRFNMVLIRRPCYCACPSIAFFWFFSRGFSFFFLLFGAVGVESGVYIVF